MKQLLAAAPVMFLLLAGSDAAGLEIIFPTATCRAQVIPFAEGTEFPVTDQQWTTDLEDWQVESAVYEVPVGFSDFEATCTGSGTGPLRGAGEVRVEFSTRGAFSGGNSRMTANFPIESGVYLLSATLSGGATTDAQSPMGAAGRSGCPPSVLRVSTWYSAERRSGGLSHG